MAGIQTSRITTDSADDLTIEPAAGKKTLLKSVDSTNPGSTPITTKTDGEVTRLDISQLEDIGTLVDENNDWVMVQDVSDGNKIKKIQAGQLLGGGSGSIPQPPFGNLPASGTWLDQDSVLAVQAGGSGSTADLRNSVEFAVADATYNQTDKNVTLAQSVYVRWVTSKLISATHGQIVSGTLYSKSGSSFTQTWNMTISKQPTSGWDLVDVFDVSASTQVTSALATPTGLNAPSPVTIDGGTLTGIEVSINGGAFTSSPGNIEDGQTISVKGTTGSSSTTGYTALISIGGLQETWTATTAAPGAAIEQPTITTPVQGATDLRPDVSLVSTIYVPINGAGTHTTSDWEIYEAAASASPPASDPPGAGYISITPSSTAKRKAVLDAGNLTESKTYYSRVRYTDGTVTSEWSTWHKFSTAAKFVLDPGDPIGGGFFAGQINDGGTIYNIIVAPTDSGLLQGQYGGQPPSPIKWTDNFGTDQDDLNEVYGATATLANSNNDGKHPMFDWCISDSTGPNAGSYNANNATGTGLGGYNDWYIPAKHELEICYRNLKPYVTDNATNAGANPNAVPTPTGNYTAGDPTQTTVPEFQTDALDNVGAQAFSVYNRYWTATGRTENPNTAFFQVFSNGAQNFGSKTAPASNFARAIRREAD